MSKPQTTDKCFCHHYYHHNEHNQGLGLKACSFKAQGVGLSLKFSE
jgi:hypothetical protein